MPTKIQQKSHNFWGNVAYVPKNPNYGFNQDIFPVMLYKIRSIHVPNLESPDLQMPKWIKIDFLKSFNFE